MWMDFKLLRIILLYFYTVAISKSILFSAKMYSTYSKINIK